MGFIKLKSLFLYYCCFLFLCTSVLGASELSRGLIVSGAGVGVSGDYEIKTSIGQPFASAYTQVQNTVIDVGLLSGLENSVVSNATGQIDGVFNQTITISFQNILSVLNAYDPDGDSISILLEPISGSIGSSSVVLRNGESIDWEPPIIK